MYVVHPTEQTFNMNITDVNLTPLNLKIKKLIGHINSILVVKINTILLYLY